MAWLFCGMLLLCPLFRAQVGAMYFEIPLATCTMMAVVAYVRGDFRQALIWGTLCVLVKTTGLVVIGALAVATLCQQGSLIRRCGRSLTLASCGFAAAFWPLLASDSDQMVMKVEPSSSFWQHLREYHYRFLSIPDLTAAVGLVVLIGFSRPREIWRSLADQPALRQNMPLGVPPQESFPAEADPSVRVNESPSFQISSRVTGVSFLLVVMFALFIGVLPYYAHRGVLGLPRYLVFLLPFVFFALTHWLVVRMSLRRAAMALAAVSILFVGNREGLWYPTDERDEISTLERGENYRWLVEVQRESTQAAADLPDDVVIYYGFAEHFFMANPWMGYTNRTHPGGRQLYVGGRRTVSLKSEDHPERFFVIYSNPGVLGFEAHILLANASKDPSRKVRIHRRCQRGPYRIDVVEVTKIVKPKPESDTL